MKKILLAEDEQAISKVLALKLTNSGFSVTVVDNGEKALAEIAKNELPRSRADGVSADAASSSRGFIPGASTEEFARKNKYDLILLDLLMPKVDGWAVLEKLKGSNLKIVVMSNLGQEEDIKKAKALGALDFFIKADVPLLDIVQKITTILT